SELFLQRADGSFERKLIPAFIEDSVSTTTCIAFFDADNDGDLDIYAVSGGYADYSRNDPRLQDRLFLNGGQGNFVKATEALPKMYCSTSVVTFADIDGDGDLDLFCGGRVMPGEYPNPPPSFLLLNDGKGKFSDATAQWIGAESPGMITDAKWIDINQDKKPDLILAGE